VNIKALTGHQAVDAVMRDIEQAMGTSKRQGKFIQGFVYALAQLIRMDREDMAMELWEESGFIVEDLSQCDSYDADILKELIARTG